VIRSLTELQKGWVFYLITLGLALLVALFGPTGPIQILNMLTVTAGVLLMLLVVTPDGYHKAGWAPLGLHRAGWRYWPLALLAPTAVLVASFGATTLLGVVSWRLSQTPQSTLPSTLLSPPSSPSSRRSAGAVTCCRSWPAATRGMAPAIAIVAIVLYK
jgi:hypothetical protein